MDTLIDGGNDIRFERVIGRFPRGTICKSAVVVKKHLLILQLDREDDLNSDVADIVILNFRTGKLIKSWKDSKTFAGLRTKQRSLLINSSETHLIACANSNITVFAIKKAFKITNRLFSTENGEETIARSDRDRNYINLFSSVRTLNDQEILIVQEESLVKWNFYVKRDINQLPKILDFDCDVISSDFRISQGKNILVVLENYSERDWYSSQIKIFDLTHFTLLSKYNFEVWANIDIWCSDIENGWLSIIQYKGYSPMATVSILKLDSFQELEEANTITIRGKVKSYCDTSNEFAGLCISLDLPNLTKSILGFFNYKKQLILHSKDEEEKRRIDASSFWGIYNISLDKTDFFLGTHNGSIFLTKKSNIFKDMESSTIEEFFLFLYKI